MKLETGMQAAGQAGIPMSHKVVAGGAASSFVWLEKVQEFLHGLSAWSAEMLPIAGLSWVVIQAYYFVKGKRNQKVTDKE